MRWGIGLMAIVACGWAGGLTAEESGGGLACYLYEGSDLAVSIVGEWEATVPIVIGELWGGGTAQYPLSVLFEGLEGGQLEITSWASMDGSGEQVATGELVEGELACVEYPASSELIFRDGFESGNASAWSTEVP